MRFEITEVHVVDIPDSEVEFDRAYAEEFGTGDAENSSFGAMWALEWIPNHMRDMQEAACETFESY